MAAIWPWRSWFSRVSSRLMPRSSSASATVPEDVQDEGVRDRLHAVTQDDDAHGLDVALAQVGRADIDLVVERARELGDAFPGRFGDQRAAAQRA